MADDTENATNGPARTDRDQNTGKAGYKLYAALGAAVGAAIARKALTASWRTATGKEPPTNLENPEVGWAEALSWAVASAAAVAAAKLVARRRVALTWQRASGGPAPGLDDTGT